MRCQARSPRLILQRGLEMIMDRILLALGSLLAFLAVGAGAFAAHGLRARLAPEMLAIFETAARYQMYHALGVLVVAWYLPRWPSVAAAGWLFIVGVLVFSGSLYLLALTGQRWLGALTPIGGLCFLAGWAVLAWGAWRA